MHFSGRPDIPRDCSLKIRPSCLIPSNALDISKNIPLTSRDGQQSNA